VRLDVLETGNWKLSPSPKQRFYFGPFGSCMHFVA
jgi:hypothetical protein